MKLPSFTTLLAFGTMAAAAPAASRDATTHNLFVGGPGQLLSATFDGKAFNIVGSHVTAGEAPSWMAYKASTKTIYAVNENGVDLNVFKPTDKGFDLAGSSNGSSGVVFLGFNKDQTRMVGAGYGAGALDLWDISAAGSPKLLKNITVTGTLGPNQTGHHPHQAILDPSGRFMVVPDLGGDQLLVVSLEADKFEIISNIAFMKGSGPRHGSFIAGGGKTYFICAFELSNRVDVWETSYVDDRGIDFKYLNEQSTYGPVGPKNTTSAAAGAVLVAANQKDVYISNRLTGDDADSIAHFVFDPASATLKFQESISSTGISPRSMGFSADQSVLFVANQGGKNGLAAFTRDATTGKLSTDPIGALPYEKSIAPGMETTDKAGPEFITAYVP
ncbi:Lactonase, 7-bladed beta-propeller-domain-containing protein [Nemania sp. FL0916]|nr:Lactonase, 7-bladed beta-propeller-domain-containing protein [Nemania sp. FL0916]